MTTGGGSAESRACPDDGTCHHECAGTDCFRVRYCAPLSGVYPRDEWPAGAREIVLPGPEIGHL